MAENKIRRALIAVYDKTGITEFARALVDEFGIEIISTGGTAKHLKEAGIPVTMVEEVTGFPEMLDGRVKTLHPKIHAAILADRNNPDHMRQLAEHGIQPIDMVVVNLYPFEKTVADPNCKFEDAIEMIDIGGPCLLRAAAKNHKHVWPICEPRLYNEFLEMMREPDEDVRCSQDEERDLRRTLAGCVFRKTSEYDETIRRYFSDELVRETGDVFGKPSTAKLPSGLAVGMHKVLQCRYGENPHQGAAAYAPLNDPGFQGEASSLRGGYSGEPSFNNLIDADAALGLCAELTRAGSSVWHRLIAGANVSDRLLAGPTLAGSTLAGSTLAGPTSTGVIPSGVIPSGGTATSSTKSDQQLPPISEQEFTRRHLPHIQRPGATYFVTFRTRHGQLAPEERDIVMECCVFPDGKKACIHAATVMPDHVHIVMTPLDASPDQVYHLGDILHGIKGVSARRIADRRGRGSGPVWQDESFDRIMRGEKEYLETLEYVRRNPVTAGLCREGEYPWCVIEVEAGWNKFTDSAGVDRRHKIVCDCHDELLRPWNRLLAGSTQDQNQRLATGSTEDQNKRLVAGSTQDQKHRLLPGATLPGPSSVVFIKHTNACGVGIDQDVAGAYRRAYLGDPNAAMGGILGVNFPVTADFAAMVMETYDRFGKAAGVGGFFIEVWVAPGFGDDAIKIIRTKKKWGQNVRLLAVGDLSVAPDTDGLEYRTIAGGMLVQSRDLVGLNEEQWKVVTKRKPSEAEMADLRLAWLVAKHTKSNAISLCKDGMLIGNGAGQMSRVMSCRIATWLAKENGHVEKLAGSVAASDAFFPFRDGPEILLEAGVTAIIQPGGSKRDEETIAACDARGAAMIFTGTRHFKH